MDYNIYIHDKTSSSGKATLPRDIGGTNTTPTSSGSSATSSGGSGLGIFQKVKNFMGSEGGGSNYGLALGIYVAAIKLAWKITNVIENNVTPLIARETGDYRHQIQWQNISNGVSMLANPLGAAVGVIRNQHELMVLNRKQAQEQLMLGDSIVNTISRKV